METMNLLKNVVFLDRDGVINRDSPDYIKNWPEFEFLPGSLAAIANLTLKGFTIILITNQSMINRGISTREDLEHMHAMMIREVESAGGKISDIFYCPHAPVENCACRKPKPGLIHAAQEAWRIDLDSAHMVGDSPKDIECAINAGCGRAILVKTGNGASAAKVLQRKGIPPDYIAENLFDAANWIIGT